LSLTEAVHVVIVEIMALFVLGLKTAELDAVEDTVVLKNLDL